MLLNEHFECHSHLAKDFSSVSLSHSGSNSSSVPSDAQDQEANEVPVELLLMDLFELTHSNMGE